MGSLFLDFPRIHRATAFISALGIVFWLFFQVNKNGPFRDINPFAVDLYDAVGSFAVQGALLLGVLNSGRWLLRQSLVPVRRQFDQVHVHLFRAGAPPIARKDDAREIRVHAGVRLRPVVALAVRDGALFIDGTRMGQPHDAPARLQLNREDLIVHPRELCRAAPAVR